MNTLQNALTRAGFTESEPVVMMTIAVYEGEALRVHGLSQGLDPKQRLYVVRWEESHGYVKMFNKHGNWIECRLTKELQELLAAPAVRRAFDAQAEFRKAQEAFALARKEYYQQIEALGGQVKSASDSSSYVEYDYSWAEVPGIPGELDA